MICALSGVITANYINHATTFEARAGWAIVIVLGHAGVILAYAVGARELLAGVNGYLMIVTKW